VHLLGSIPVPEVPIVLTKAKPIAVEAAIATSKKPKNAAFASDSRNSHDFFGKNDAFSYA
jgi:hypothetical protein